MGCIAVIKRVGPLLPPDGLSGPNQCATTVSITSANEVGHLVWWFALHRRVLRRRPIADNLGRSKPLAAVDL